jgi:hypothetical protein
LSSSHTP